MTHVVWQTENQTIPLSSVSCECGLGLALNLRGSVDVLIAERMVLINTLSHYLQLVRTSFEGIPKPSFPEQKHKPPAPSVIHRDLAELRFYIGPWTFLTGNRWSAVSFLPLKFLDLWCLQNLLPAGRANLIQTSLMRRFCVSRGFSAPCSYSPVLQTGLMKHCLNFSLIPTGGRIMESMSIDPSLWVQNKDLQLFQLLWFRSTISVLGLFW